MSASAHATGKKAAAKVAKVNGKAEPGPFGVLLKELRAKYGISQAQLAEGTGISPGYIGLIETGVRGDKPSLDVIKRMSMTMGANVDETEALMRAAGWLGARERLIREGRPDLREVISDDATLAQPEKDLLLHMLEVFRYEVRTS